MTFAAYIQLQKSRITGKGWDNRAEVSAKTCSSAEEKNAPNYCDMSGSRTSVGATAAAYSSINKGVSNNLCAAAHKPEKNMGGVAADSEQLLREINSLSGLNTKEREFYAAMWRARSTCLSSRSAV